MLLYCKPDGHSHNDYTITPYAFIRERIKGNRRVEVWPQSLADKGAAPYKETLIMHSAVYQLTHKVHCFV